jgi:hypothetical protein
VTAISGDSGIASAAPPGNAPHAPTMIFDTRCHVENDPDGAADFASLSKQVRMR